VNAEVNIETPSFHRSKGNQKRKCRNREVTPR
jgi:hypothetical protein